MQAGSRPVLQIVVKTLTIGRGVKQSALHEQSGKDKLIKSGRHEKTFIYRWGGQAVHSGDRTFAVRLKGILRSRNPMTGGKDYPNVRNKNGVLPRGHY